MVKEKEVRKITSGLILSWVLGVLFAGNFIVYLLLRQPIPTIASFVIAIVLLPPTNKIIKDKLNFELSRSLKITIVIIGIISMMFTGDVEKLNSLLEDDSRQDIPAPQIITQPTIIQKPAETKQKVKSATLSIDRVQIQLANLYPTRVTVTNTGDVPISPKFDLYVYQEDKEICAGSPIFGFIFESIESKEKKTDEITLLGCLFEENGDYTMRIDLLDSDFNKLDSKTKSFTVNDALIRNREDMEDLLNQLG